LNDAKSVGNPKDLVQKIRIPNIYGMALVNSLHDSKPSTFDETSQRHVWLEAMRKDIIPS